MKLLKYQIFLVGVIGVLYTAEAQFQRMGIKKGIRLTIPANSNGKINTYCMDYTLKAPISGTEYRKIISDPSSARVKFEGESSKSLQEAIDAGEIIIEGMSMTFDGFLENLDDPIYKSRLTKAEREVLDAVKEIYKDEWDKLSQTEKNKINDALIRYGDPTKMKLINKTEKKVSISFIDNSILGVDKNVKIDGLNASLLNGRNQLDLWFFRGREHQKKLKELGFYKGKIDGKIGLNSKKAIKDFQIHNGLKPTGMIDPETDQLLVEAFYKKREENKRLREYLKASEDYKGTIDGIIGKKSHESITSFKAKYGLSQYDIETTVLNDNVYVKFKKPKDFIDYYGNLDKECNLELCLSDEMSISFTNSCFPGSFSVSTSSGVNMTIEAGGISYNLTLIEGEDKSQNKDGCRLSRGACFSRTIEKEYSIECKESKTTIEVSATEVSLSLGNLSISLY